jgi:hypothetical protein
MAIRAILKRRRLLRQSAAIFKEDGQVEGSHCAGPVSN